MPQKLIAQGAEAKLFLEGNKIIKNRFPKSYRIKEIDEKLRGFRTRREAKILQKLQAINFPAPKLLKNDERENLIIENIGGKLVKEVLENSDYKKLCSEIGKKIAILHNNSIIHGDLTTSNMILNKQIYFIDFGLCTGVGGVFHSGSGFQMAQRDVFPDLQGGQVREDGSICDDSVELRGFPELSHRKGCLVADCIQNLEIGIDARHT